MTDKTPRIYVACLSAYCNGRLHGAWIDCNQDADDIWKEIKKMLSNSPEADAEEWAIHCHENWQGIDIGEHENIERIAELAEILVEHGAAFGAYCKYCGKDDASPEEFTDHYIGEYKSEEDFVRDRWDDEGKLSQLEAIGISEDYIDWEAIARDWFIDSYYSADVDGKVYVFSRH
jgi:antirestriction protein